MERTKVTAKGKAKTKLTTTASSKGKTKLKARPRITATVQQLPNTAADGEQSLPDAGSEVHGELMQRIKLAYPIDSDDKTKGSTSHCESKIGDGSCEEEGVSANQAREEIPYPFQPLEDPTAIHGEVQFNEEALHDIDLGEDPPFLNIPSKMRFKCGLHAETL
ncbi:hypothetical protein H257_15758 [Aphanomyces astaci]|uniref:Uncharacterized protein n=1 Tax=Aphanomyces astaci TaxID=112090 RepID=W4FNA1_APHAT|nr:hypothetical protein H257_15758 [Aphanomyces astaci]ETV68319.1 hypothetical protein H257_15758 [Aphanomyces astaci]|eukprot:XP_009842262.1 hypothetical protein H257_15758 [Aphanomyces astaci]